MIAQHYGFRNFFKAFLCRIRDTIDYANRHPYTLLQDEAGKSTLEFVKEHCRFAVPCRSPRQLLDLALQRTSLDGTYLEFGVFRGATLRHIAKRKPEFEVHGFDSFEGLPEDWRHYAQNAFTTGGKLPKVPGNVRLWKGYFEDTLPGWVEQHPGTVAFVHIDCDLRSSTATIFQHIASRLQPGSVLLFDDYFNFPYWQEDGHAVFRETIETYGWKVDYIGFAYKELAAVLA